VSTKPTSFAIGPHHLPQSVDSAMLLMPMPYLKREKAEAGAIGSSSSVTHSPAGPNVVVDAEESEPRGLKRILSRQPPKPRRRRNLLVLPEVDMPDLPEEPLARPSQCTIRESPPPMEDRTVRFIIPPTKFAPPIECR
jgi:hypothetical protein